MRRLLVPGILLGALVFTACPLRSDVRTTEGAASPSPTVAATAASPPSGESPSPREGDRASRLVGVWTIDLQSKLAALLAPYGGVPSDLSCQGAENLMFGREGEFLATLAGRCEFMGSSGAVDGGQAGTYRDEGNTFVLQDVTGRLSGEIRGITVPLAAWDRVTEPVSYRIQENTLVIDYSMPDGARDELNYLRA